MQFKCKAILLLALPKSCIYTDVINKCILNQNTTEPLNGKYITKQTKYWENMVSEDFSKIYTQSLESVVYHNLDKNDLCNHTYIL